MMLALSGIASASASAALPEFTKNTIHNKFTGESGGGFLTNVGGEELGECKKVIVTGEIVNSKEVAKVKMKFTECCFFSDGKVFETKELRGRLGYIRDGKEPTVGLLLEPVTEPFATSNWYSTPTHFQGSIIGSLTGLNKHSTSFTLKYSPGAKPYEQGPRAFEGEKAIHQLSMLEFEEHEPIPEEFSFTGRVNLTTEKEIEIAA